MPKSDVLYQLIHTLSKSEKRHFKIYAKKYNTKSVQHQILLFDVINKQSKYDEEKLLKKFKGTTIAKNFNYEKNQLQTLILRALQDYYPEYSITIILHNLLQQIEILRSKRQHVLVERFLNRAYKLAELHEKFLYLAQIIQLQIALKFEFKESNWEELSAKLLEVQEKNTREAQYYAALLEAYHINLTHLENNKNAVKEKLGPIIENPLFQDKSLAITFKCQQYFWMVWSIYYRGAEDWKKQEVVCYKVKQLFEDNPIFIESAFDRYVGYCANYLGALLLNEKMEESKTELAFFADLPQKYESFFTDSLQNYWQNIYNGFRLNIYEMEGDYAAIYQLKKDDIQQDKINMIMAHDTFMMIKACFILKKYDEALNNIQDYFATTQKDGLQHLTFYIKVMEFLIHYDLGNERLLDSLQKNVYYFHRQKQIDPNWAQPIVSLIRKLSQPASKRPKELLQKERIQAIELFLDKIKMLPNEKHSFRKVLTVWSNRQLED